MGISVAQRNTGYAATSTSYAITLPSSGAVAGDMYLISLTATGGTHSTVSGGWSKIGQWNNGASVVISTFTGVVGVAGALTIANTANSTATYVGLRVSGAWTTQAWAAGTGVTGSSATHTTASLTPSLGTRRYLWVTVDGVQAFAANYAPGSAPSGWSNLTSAYNIASSNLTTTAERISVAGSVTPGNWGVSAGGSGFYVGNTLAIPEAPENPKRQLNNNIVLNRAALI